MPEEAFKKTADVEARHIRIARKMSPALYIIRRETISTNARNVKRLGALPELLEEPRLQQMLQSGGNKIPATHDQASQDCVKFAVNVIRRNRNS